MSQHARNNPEMYERSPEARVFSPEQEVMIARFEQQCMDAGCEGEDHYCV